MKENRWLSNVDLDNGLVFLGNKLLTEPMLTHI